MNKVLLNFSKYTDGGFESKAGTILASMTDNDFFPTPVPALTVLADALEGYSQWLADADSGNRSDIAIKNTRRLALEAVLRQLANYINYTAAGDRSKLLTTGFDVSKEREPITITKPENMRVVNGKNSGELIASVKRVKGAVSYMHEYILEEALETGNWTAFTSSSAKFTFTNLQPGKNYICRIAAIGAKGQIVYSDPVGRIVV